MVDVHNRDKKVTYWGFRILLAGVTACVPVFITSYFDYRKVKAEQATGYEETKHAVEELQAQTKKNVEEIAYLKGRLDQRGYTTLHSDTPPPAPPAPPVAVQFKKLPEFDEVVMKAQAKK